jgi:hypothetical protein
MEDDLNFFCEWKTTSFLYMKDNPKLVLNGTLSMETNLNLFCKWKTNSIFRCGSICSSHYFTDWLTHSMTHWRTDHFTFVKICDIYKIIKISIMSYEINWRGETREENIEQVPNILVKFGLTGAQVTIVQSCNTGHNWNNSCCRVRGCS